MREKKYKVNLKSFDGKMKHLRMSEYNVYMDGADLMKIVERVIVSINKRII